MNHYLFTAVILMVMSHLNCEKKANNEPQLPTCIQAKIDEIKKQPRWNPPAQIEEYNYNGKRVFLFSSNCCDQFNPLYDEQCNYICAPSGGMTGKGDRKCEDFKDKAKFVKVIWKDER